MGSTESSLIEHQAAFLRRNPELATDQKFAELCEAFRQLGQAADELGYAIAARQPADGNGSGGYL